MPSLVKEEDEEVVYYYDSVECLLSSETSSVNLTMEEETVGMGSKWDYGIWIDEPLSVEQRREHFLRKMGFSASSLTNDKAFDRMSECSGTVSLSGSSSIEETSFSVGRETEDGTTLNVDEFNPRDSTDYDTETQITFLPSLEEMCNQVCQVEQSDKDTTKGNKRTRRWAQLLKMSCGKGPIGSHSPPLTMNPMKFHQKKKKCTEFSAVYVGQEIKAHKGFIWTMKFSPDGQYLASGGQDGVVRIWRVKSEDSSTKYPASGSDVKSKLKHSSVVIPDKVFEIGELPVQELYGHSGDVLDLAWSKSNCLLSCSKDKTVRLWQVGCNDCINIFHHSDYVTCIQFHPVDDMHFISGCIDGKVRIWGLSNDRVADWVYARDVVTAVCYQPDGRGFIVGSISGTCCFYGIDGADARIQLEAQVHIQGRKKTSRNKITGIEFCHKGDQRIMITSADSRVRIFEGITMIHKYKGLRKSGSQLSASFTSTGSHIISIGEDSRIYVWNYDSQPKTSSKQSKSIYSCEHLFSKGVSVALPWSGRPAGHQNESLSSHQQQRVEMRGTEGFSLGSWFSMDNQCCSGASATWPEEQLPHCGLASTEVQQNQNFANEKSKLFEAWNLVIVTADLDGSIRTFHNFGLPVKQ